MTREILSNRRGVALVVVLWVTVLLTVIANSFIGMVRTETQQVGNDKQGTEAYFLARSGISLGVSQLLDDVPSKKWLRDGRPYRISMSKGFTEVRVTDEGGKINVNQASRSDLLRVLITLGVKGSRRDMIADSILDWRDENNFHRLNGAEDDYYRLLEAPYEAKDGPFDTLDELLWVKGVTDEIFFGDPEENPFDPEEEFIFPAVGLNNILTVYGESGSVNVNTAPPGVLLSLPGIDEETARMILGRREEGEIQDMGDFTRAGGDSAPQAGGSITFGSPGIYTIEARGELGEGRVTHSIKAVVKVIDEKQYRIIYWKDLDSSRRGRV